EARVSQRTAPPYGPPPHAGQDGSTPARAGSATARRRAAPLAPPAPTHRSAARSTATGSIRRSAGGSTRPHRPGRLLRHPAALTSSLVQYAARPVAHGAADPRTPAATALSAPNP